METTPQGKGSTIWQERELAVGQWALLALPPAAAFDAMPLELPRHGNLI
ncbi:hypothetical protein HC956_02165 [Alcaligenes faecalis]|uniref:Uncharacterized protein n=1 Tax=Alcaligenes ammonioxydans TaxID=2582914 RepID=A0ABX8SSX4_9BURK|nr:hypothetical protein [Alcaligenes ammonioxydans]QXX77933.1 hypothetical protein FE795_02165 [Alcaligenes ammonioxydans]